MEHLRHDHSPAAAYLIDHVERFSVVDVGCSGGLHPAWNICGDKLHAIGFDPVESEIARLTSAEARPNVRYRYAFVVGDEGPHLRRDPSSRLSYVRTLARRDGRDFSLPKPGIPESVRRQIWPGPEIVRLPAALSAGGLIDLDFIKIDIDGGDFEVLATLPETFAQTGALGAVLEVNFIGGPEDGHHTFHNTDRLMRQCGFDLFDLSVRRYASSALPQPYVNSFPAQTIRGRPLQGDALYLRDLGWTIPQHEGLDEAKIIKLAALFTLFNLQDQAAEVLIHHRERLAPVLNVEHCLDLLTAELGFDGGYAAYMDRFDADDPMFYPPT